MLFYVLKIKLPSIEAACTKAKEELAQTTAQHQMMMEHLTASVIISSAQGKTLYVSPYTEILTGYSPRKVYAMEADLLSTIILPEDLPRYQRAAMVSRLGEEIVVRCQIRHRHSLSLWLEIHFVPIFAPNGELGSILRVCFDVTSSVRYQNQVEEQNQELSDFAAMVSHDLKSPIFTIKGMASTLLDEHQQQLDEEGKELLGFVLSGAKRLESLVDSILEYSTITMKYLEEQDLSLQSVLRDVLEDLTPQIEAKQAEIHLPDRLPAIHGEPIRIYQVFANLIGNALKYSAVDRKTVISISFLEGDMVEIKVTDNGKGIPADHLGEIFRPYRRLYSRSTDDESGFGLACVKKIVERLGGSIRVESIENLGSTFILLLPPAREKERTEKEEPIAQLDMQ